MEKYTILQDLGQGAFGKVYKAERKEDGSALALKYLTVDSVDKGDVLLKEIRALQQVGEHPNILQYTEVFTETDLNSPALNVWLVLGYCIGGTLDSFITSNKADRAAILQLLCDTAEGVAYLHGKNVIHGALKPDNVMVDNSGQRPVVKIADFGLVRACEQGGWDINTYHRQDANGTRMYLAPEIISPLMAQRPDLVRYTAEADVFAMGLIFTAILQLDDPIVPAKDPAAQGTDPEDPVTDSASQGTDPADPVTDPAAQANDQAVPSTDPTDLVTDLAAQRTDPSDPGTHPATDPAKPGKLVPALDVNGQPTAVAEVMIANPGYPLADMLLTSEPPGSPVKALILSMLAVSPPQRPTSEKVLGSLKQIINSSDADSAVVKTPSPPPQPPHIVVKMPESSGSSKAARCCAACWSCDSEHDWYNCEGKGCGWKTLIIIMWVIVGIILIALFLVVIVVYCYLNVITDGKIAEAQRPTQVNQVTRVQMQQANELLQANAVSSTLVR